MHLAAASIPVYDHVVIVMEENHSYADIIGNTSNAPYMNTLAGQGALMTDSFGVTHPSEPNYMALFGGSTFGLSADTFPVTESTANLGSELLGAGDTFLRLLRGSAVGRLDDVHVRYTPASTRRGSTSATCRPPTR